MEDRAETVPQDTKDAKNVIVLGLTQNGKSSFINSILRYNGASIPDSATIGGGSSSQTKDVTKYTTGVSVRQYIARKNGLRTDITHNSEGTRVTITYSDDGNEVSRQYEPLRYRANIVQEFETSVHRLQAGLIPDTPDQDSGCIFKLNIYDTPGLSDSEGLKDLEEDFKRQGYSDEEATEAASKSTRNFVDERHKIAIVKAVNKMENLHGVCLVIRDGKNFGPELQHLKSLVEMFRRMSPSLNYYIIHTRVTNTTMFKAKTLHRIPISENFFGIIATHFFVNNEPDIRNDAPDPLSKHFAYRVLSDFLSKLSDAPGVDVTGLRFPKPDDSQDRQLLSTLGFYSAYLESNARILQSKIGGLVREKQYLRACLSVYDKELKELNDRLTATVTEDQASSLRLSINEVTQLKSSREEPLRSLENQISACDKKISENKAKLKEIADAEILLRTNFIDISQDSSSYLLTNNLYCHALGYGLLLRLPRELIPQLQKSGDHQSSKKALSEYLEIHRQMENMASKSLDVVKNATERWKKALKQLELIDNRLNNAGVGNPLIKDFDVSQDHLTMNLNRIKLPDSINGDSVTETSKASEFVQRYKSRVQDLCQYVGLQWRDLIYETQENLIAVQNEVQHEVKRVKEILKNLEQVCQASLLEVLYHKASCSAAIQINQLLNAETYSLGEFTVLRLAFEELQRNEVSDDPFVKLAQGIAYSLQVRWRQEHKIY